MGCLFIQAPAIANRNDSTPLGSRPKQYEVPNVEPIKIQTTMAQITATAAACKAADYGKVELEFSTASDKVYRISSEAGGYQKIESHSITVFPSLLEGVLKDPNICDSAADVSEFVACIGRDLEVRELSMIIANGEMVFDQVEDHKTHDFLKAVFSKVTLGERAKERLARAIEKYGEL